GVNDDAPHRGESATKQDGDYFIVTSDKLILTSQSTKSDWQHDWVPATNKSSRGTRFFVYSPPTTNSPRDLNVFAYEDSTTVTIKQVSTQALNGSGYTQVNLSANQVVAQRELMVGEEILWHYPEGRNILQSGHTYLVETNKPVTVQYGALWGNARDGGGYVPSGNGSSAGELFYFAVPYQSAREQEIRIVSWDDANSVSLDFYQQGSWVNIQTWTLDALDPADWISYSGNLDGVFRVQCSSGKKVSVFEANWLETGSPGTSDVASMLSSRYGTTAGTEFLAYMAPPGYESNVSDPFTNTKFSAASHLYLFAQNGATVQVTDAHTGGQVINRTYQIQPGRYVDAYLTLAEWKSIYNGDGNPNSGPERPYLFVSADQPISVFNTNFNDNWMAYCGTSLPQGFGLRSDTDQDRTQPGDTLTIRAHIDLSPGQILANPTLEVLVGDGGTVSRAELDDLADQTTYQGSPEPQANTGHTLVRFDSLPALDGSHQYEATTEIVVSANYHDGRPIPDQTVIPVDYSLSGELNGVYEQAASSQGVTNRTNDQQSLMLARQPEAGAAVTDGEDTWGFAWVDYNGDGYQDLFVPTYDPQRPNRLYHNQGNGTFVQVSGGALTSDLGSAVSATWGDYDNDGDPDVFVASNVGAVNHLYRNDGGSFTRVDAGALSDYNGYCHSAAWVDYDQDGYLDLFVTDYMPTRFNTLWHNDGDGTFSLASGAGPLVEEAAYSLGAVWADYDLDGDPDLFVPNDRNAPNSLYRNEGNGQFAKILGGDIGSDAGSSVGASWGDYDNDGDPDLFVANAGAQASFLYRNDG
ncbi:MAG: VCBS repeat-containing protein, partial [Bacteroidetes bacterium]